MGNHSLNSLALISGRYTWTSIKVLAELAAAHLLALCQTLDLRAMQANFLECYQAQLTELVEATLKPGGPSTTGSTADPQFAIWTQLLESLDSTVTMETKERFPYISKTMRVPILDLPSFQDLPDAL